MRTAPSTSLSPPKLSLSITPGTHAQFSGSRRTSASQQQSPALFGRLSQLTPYADAVVASCAHSQSQVKPISQSSSVPAVSSGATPALTSDPAPPTVAAQVSVVAPSYANRTAAPPASAEAEVSGTPAPRPARHPLSLTQAEYEAEYSQSHLPQVQSPNEAVDPQQTEEIRPNTPYLPSPEVSRTCAAASSSYTTVSAAHSSPKLRTPRSRKRRTEIASPSAESAAKQATPSGPVLPHPATRASPKSAAVTAVAAVVAPSAVPKASSTSTPSNLLPFALPPSRDSSLSPQRPLRIAEPNSSSESLAVSEPGRASTTRVQLPAPPAAASSTEPVIVLDDDDTPPERTVELPPAEEDDWERAERAPAQPALSSAARVAAVQELTQSLPAPTAVSSSLVSTAAAHAPLSAVTSVVRTASADDLYLLFLCERERQPALSSSCCYTVYECAHALTLARALAIPRRHRVAIVGDDLADATTGVVACARFVVAREPAFAVA